MKDHTVRMYALAVTPAILGLTIAMMPPHTAVAAAPHASPPNTWQNVASLPTAGDGFAAAAGHDGKIYIIGGYTPNVATTSVEAYTPSTDSWASRAPMPTARACAAATTGADGRIYLLGGCDSGGYSLNTAEVYTPSTDTWSALPPMHTQRASLGAATGPDGLIYAIGGLYNSSSGGNVFSQASVERYTPSTNSWAFITTPMPTARDKLGATTGADGRIYAIGGETLTPLNTAMVPTVEAYTPSTDTWTTAAPISAGRGLGVGVATGPDGLVYAIGGTDLNLSATQSHVVQAYTPASDSWATVAPTNDLRRYSGVALGSDGRIYAIGGLEANPPYLNALATAEAYTPSPYPVAVAVLPAMSNGAYGGVVTAATIQNTGPATSSVRIAYVDQNGAAAGTGDLKVSLPSNASWTVRQDNGHSFAAGGAGSAIVYSDQPIASFVNEFASGTASDATSYTGIPLPSGVGATLYAPTIVNNAFGGYTTGIGLLNVGGGAADVTITYRGGTGALVKTQTLTALPPKAYRALYSGDGTLGLPDGFAGTATITGSAGALLGAVVNETGPGGQFSSYDAQPSGSLSLNAPVALNNAFGGYFTGMGIQNTSGTAGSVSVTYYDSTGTIVGAAHTFSITGNGSLAVYQGSATDGPPAAQSGYTAVISSTLPLAAIVNEVAPAGSGSARQSTSYNTFPAGSSTLHLPLVENGGADPWNTGEGIMNTGSAATTVTVSYYDQTTGVAVGMPQTSTLQPKAFLAIYQPAPTSGLPAGSRATAVVATTPGGQVAVITNERSPSTFMSYNGQ